MLRYRDCRQREGLKGAEHPGYNIRSGCFDIKYRRESYVFLVKPLIQPDLVGRRRLQRGGFDNVLTLPGKMGNGRIAENILCIDMPLEIEKGFYRKEYPVHRHEEGVKQEFIYSFRHSFG